MFYNNMIVTIMD